MLSGSLFGISDPTGSVVSSAALTAAADSVGLSVHPAVLRRTTGLTQPISYAQCEQLFGVPCYDPEEIETAYHEGPLFARGVDGRGQTIVIVDSFGSPTIKSDLASFDRAYGLPAPPSFQIIQPAGRVPPFNINNSDEVGWAGETTLDVEWAHSVAPGANILLVETPVSETEGTAGFPQIVEAENYVIDHHMGDVISQSFSATEETFPTAHSLLDLRSAYINAYQHGVTVLAASGDSGATDYSNAAGTLYYTYPVTSWPDSDPLVTGVGGTELQLDPFGRVTAPTQAWNDTYNQTVNEYIFGDAGPNPLAGGGGKSIVFHRPYYQGGVAGVVGDQRGVPDISMSASCSGPVTTFESYPGVAGTWSVSCGTSEASPLFAGIVALADQVAGHPLGLINPALYRLSAGRALGIVDVTLGNNTVSFTQNGEDYTVQGFDSLPGYDLASGVGTVNAARFVPELAAASR